MAIHLPTDRAELEVMALHSCSTEELYELRDSIEGADDVGLYSIIINNDDPQNTKNSSNFIAAVQPAYRRLLFIKIRFRLLDTEKLSVKEVMAELDAIDRQERQVMLDWAYATQDINPGMVADVQAGRCSYTHAIGDYLYKMFVSN